jgi:hypothetical protein
MALLTALRGAITLIAVFTLPGWFLLSFWDAWKDWPGLQRWVVATGISVAFYPVLFYWARLIPGLTLGPYKMTGLLLAFGLVVAWKRRRDWRSLFSLSWLEWLAVAAIAMTLFTRFWMVRDLPYPAWSDSLHHALLTHLTAVQGRLPTTMEPYFPVLLDDYHLGLYAISGTVEWLARVPAHTALLWTAQALNGLCAIGVYLVLDRKVGRLGALVGTVAAGLLSHQPAFYVNWGRFTQLSSQVILLIAWVVTWETLMRWKRSWPAQRSAVLWRTAVAAVLSAAVFLLHFRVAVFYLSLLGLTLVWELWKARAEVGQHRLFLGTALLGGLALLLVLPGAWAAVRAFLIRQAGLSSVAASTLEVVREGYFEFPWETVPILAAREWLLAVAVLCAILSVLRRNGLALLTLLWTASLYLMANTYHLGLGFPNLTNLGAVLIMFYLPIGIILGVAVEEMLQLLGGTRRETVARGVAALILLAGFVASHLRVLDIELHRYFVTTEDVEAMQWIAANTDEDALFAVNTYFWFPHHPHGTDAGYWIPYFTGRDITAAVMLLSLAAPDYQASVVQLSQAAEGLTADGSSLEELRSLGVDYIYIGAKGDFSGPSLDATQLCAETDAKLVYQTPHVAILEL